jgi:hypothetical protein
MATACCDDFQDASSVAWHEAHAAAPTNSALGALADLVDCRQYRPTTKAANAIAIRTTAANVATRERVLDGIPSK